MSLNFEHFDHALTVVRPSSMREVILEVPKVKWSDIQWKNMAGMRDKLIHDYVGVNYTLVWEVLKIKIPILHTQIEDVLEKENTK